MPLGLCMSCDRLKPIVPKEFYADSKQRRWFPVEHDTPATHRGCGAVVEQTDEDEFKCEACGVVWSDEVEWPTRCDGHKREIK